MIAFPCCKINIGLDILRRRSDGFHDIRTVIYPVHGLCDSVEMVVEDYCLSDQSGIDMNISGIRHRLPASFFDDNLVNRAWSLMHDEYGIEGLSAHLHKMIPVEAGLGGGSSDGAAALLLLNEIFRLKLSHDTLIGLAARLGSDVAFFIDSQTALCSGRGDVIEPFELNLSGWRLVIAKPSFGISTAQAYSLVRPSVPDIDLAERLQRPIEEWNGLIKNDFEQPLFELYPLLRQIKNAMIESGAVYASLSGSGSAMWGLFPLSITDYTKMEDVEYYDFVL